MKLWLRWTKSDFLPRLRVPLIGVFAVASLAAAAYAGSTVIWPAIVSHPYFRLRSVKVVCDSRGVEPVVLASRAGLYDGTSLWQIDGGHAERAIEEAGWVRSARIERRFPTEVRLEVLRRRPIAATVADGGVFLVDEEGVVFREEGKPSYPDLPYLTGWNLVPDRGERIERLSTEIALLRTLEAPAGYRVSQIDVTADGVYSLYLDGLQVPIRLGLRPQAERVARRLGLLLPALPAGGTDLREVDLSYRDRAVVRVTRGRVGNVLSALASKELPQLGGGNRG